MDLKCFYKEFKGSDKLDKHIRKIASHIAFKNQKIRVMPDAHDGRCAIVGFTATIGDKIIPQLIGSDIGCGVAGWKLDIKAEELIEHLPKLEKIIREFVPVGRNYNPTHVEVIENNLYGKKAKVYIEKLKCYKHLREKEKIELGIGTMGGNNHFIEIGKDKEGYVWIFTHTGSRKLGAEVNRYYYESAISHCQGKNLRKKAQEDFIQNLIAEGKEKEIQSRLIEFKKGWSKKQFNFPKELSYLKGKNARDYKHDIEIVAKYAKYNREEILEMVKLAMGLVVKRELDTIKSIDTAHNYIEKNILRKGAIYAPMNREVLIPLNMRDGVIIGKGKGNEDWNCSAPHGAGRLYSRTKARELLKDSLNEYKRTMENIWTTSIREDTIEESPMAYKPSQEIIEGTKDTVDIIEVIKPILNIKDLGEKLDFKELKRLKNQRKGVE